jgi:nitrogen fixation-related uncharacterized protein
MTTIILFIALPVALAVGCLILRAFFKFDVALHQIYDTDRERWRSLGSPMGFFWIPEDKTRFRESTMSRNDLFSEFFRAGMKWPNQPPLQTPASGTPALSHASARPISFDLPWALAPVGPAEPGPPSARAQAPLVSSLPTTPSHHASLRPSIHSCHTHHQL